MSAKVKKQKTKKVNSKELTLHYFYCLSIILLLILTSVNINKFLSQQQVLGTQIDTTDIQNEKLYWKKMTQDNPTYIDGYLQLAKVAVELQDRTLAQTYITKALTLDPNSIKILEVKHQLGL